MKPRLGARKGSGQSSATDLITTNRAVGGPGAPGGAASSLNSPGTAGTGSSSNGSAGTNTPGTAGVAGSAGSGDGGGIAILGTATIDDPSITGNTASTSDNDVDGSFSS
jgi:hypothetical protein